MSDTWWDRCTVVAVDVETTGLDTDADRVVEVAFVTARGGGGPVTDLRGWPRLVAAGRPSSPAALALHGITADMSARGHRMDEAMAQACAEIVGAVEAGHVLVGANIWFDLTMIHRSARVCAVPSFADRVRAADMRVVDPLVWDRGWRAGPRPGGGSLGSLCAAYGVGVEGAHRAGPDARAVVGLVRAMAAVAGRAQRPRGCDPQGWHEAVDAFGRGPDALTCLLHGWWVRQQVARVRRARAAGVPVAATPAGWPFEP